MSYKFDKVEKNLGSLQMLEVYDLWDLSKCIVFLYSIIFQWNDRKALIQQGLLSDCA